MPAHNSGVDARFAGRVALTKIEAVVSARLGPARVIGNAQPGAFNRQIAMYLAKHVGGWSTTKIGRFYNGRDHSTVCYAIKRIEVLRENDPEVDGLLTLLTEEIESDANRHCVKQISEMKWQGAPGFAALIDDEFLNALAERIFSRIISRCNGGSADTGAGPQPT